MGLEEKLRPGQVISGDRALLHVPIVATTTDTSMNPRGAPPRQLQLPPPSLSVDQPVMQTARPTTQCILLL